MAIQLLVNNTHLIVLGNDPIKSRYERSRLSYERDYIENFIDLLYDGNRLAELDLTTLDATGSPYASLEALEVFLSAVTDSRTTDINGDLSEGAGGTFSGSVSSAPNANDLAILAELQAINSNTDDIEVKLDAGNVSIDNIDVDTTAMEALLTTNNNVTLNTNSLITTLDAAVDTIADDTSDLVTTLGSPTDASVDYDEQGTLLERLRGMHNELAALTGDSITGVQDLTGFDIGFQQTAIPSRTNYIVFQAEGAPELLRVRVSSQVPGSPNVGFDKVFDLIERQWAPFVDNANPHILPVYSNSASLQIFPGLGGGTEASTLNVSAVFVAKDTPSGLLVEDPNAESKLTVLTGTEINAGFIQVDAPNRKQYKYAVIKCGTGNADAPNNLSIRKRGINNTAAAQADRIYDATKGRWVRYINGNFHTFIVPLYAAESIVVANASAAYTQPAGLNVSIVFTNADIDMSENDVPIRTHLGASGVATDSPTSSVLPFEYERETMTIQNKSEDTVLYWRVNDISATLTAGSFNVLNAHEIAPKGIVTLDKDIANQELFLATADGQTARYYITRGNI